MMAVAVVYGILAYLGCWDVRLLVAVARGPVLPETIAEFIIVTICLVLILLALFRHSWNAGS